MDIIERTSFGWSIGPLAFLMAIALWSTQAWAQESSHLSAARAEVAASPGNSDAQLALGEALLEARLLKEASRVFTRASRTPSGKVAGTYGLAKIKMAQDNIPGARQICRRLAKSARKSPAGAICEGNAFLAWNRGSRAIEGFEKALELEPNNAEALVGMGEVSRAQGDFAKAEAFYKRALESAPRYALAHLGLGRLYLGRDKMSEAQRQLRAAIKSAPGMAEPHYHLGTLLGNTDAAAEELRKAVDIRPGWGQGLEALGQVLAKRGDHQVAIKVLEKAIVTNPNLAGAHHQLGLSQIALKQWPQAEQSLRKSIKLVPSLSDAVISLGDVLAEQGLHDDALETYQQARDLSPADAQVAMHTGRLYRLLSRNTQARAQFSKASQLDPTLAAAELALGDIFFDMEDWDEARSHYDAAKARPNQKGVDLQHLRTRLEQLKRH